MAALRFPARRDVTPREIAPILTMDGSGEIKKARATSADPSPRNEAVTRFRDEVAVHINPVHGVFPPQAG